MKHSVSSTPASTVNVLESSNAVPAPATNPSTATAHFIGEDNISGEADLECNCVTGQEPSCPPWRVFTSTFLTIFLAEIGDKTQVSTLLMSAEFHKPWVVFLGAGSALITTTLVGVLLGRWLSKRLSPRTLDVAAGSLLALISVSLFWEVLHS